MTLQRIAIALVSVLTLALLCGPFPSQLEVNADSERDLFRTLGLTEQGLFPVKGPAIDFLPIHLGPGWYIAVSPALMLNRHPEAIHTYHAFLFALSLIALFWALRTRAGPWTSLVICLLLGTSHHTTQVMTRLWHNGLFPAAAVFWFVFLHRALHVEKASARNRNWICAWLITALLLQLHAIGGVYALCLTGAHLHSIRRNGWTKGWWAKISIGLPIGLFGTYAWIFGTTDWQQIRAISAGRGHEGFALIEVLEKLPEHCWSAWSGPEMYWLGFVVLALSLCGAAVSVWRARQTWGFQQWVLIQVFMGFFAVAWLSGLHPEARYFNGLMPGLYILAALGMHRIGQVLPPAVRQWPGSGPIVLVSAMVLVLWGGWLTLPQQPEEEDSQRALTLREQETMLNVLNRDYQLGFDTLNTRVHGPLFGALSAPRYLAYIRGMVTSRNAERLGPNEEIIMVPDGFPLPPTAEKIQTKETDEGRTIQWFQRAQRYNPKQVRVRYNDRLCNIQLPFHWFHLPQKEQKAFGFKPFPGIESCAQGDGLNGHLEITVHRIREDKPLTLLLSWFDVQNDYSSQTQVQYSHQKNEWHTVEGISPMTATTLYAVPKPDINTPLRIRIQPVRALAHIDLY